jgi:hypothetical protein
LFFFFKGNRSQTAAVQVSVATLAPALNLFQKKKAALLLDSVNNARAIEREIERNGKSNSNLNIVPFNTSLEY